MDSIVRDRKIVACMIIALVATVFCAPGANAQQGSPAYDQPNATPLILNSNIPPQSSASSLPVPANAASDEFDDLEDLDALLDLADEDIGQLSEVQVARPSVAPALDAVVSTVERRESTVGRTPAAVFVINREMIRRSGARYVPEVLRMAPGVQVAQIDSNKWAVSIRGFNGRFANKLLVQIDGRSVYNPLFAGTFWDAQGILLEDIERIEVLRGPGGAIWGANAMNGVVNIVTRKASETHGTFVEGGGGTLERSFGSVRHGGSVGETGDLRVYGQWSERTALTSPSEHSDWDQRRVGARLDWYDGDYDQFTLQGDFYEGQSGTLSTFATPTPPFISPTQYNEEITGGNILFRWNRELSETSDLQIQTYYENTERVLSPAGSRYARHRFDVDMQHSFQWRDRHHVVWGGGYQSTWDQLDTQPYFLSADPQDSQFNVASVFAQDTIELSEDYLALTLGTKLSYNDFTGGEIQPSARLLWTPSNRVSSWLAVSRAVRTTSRVTRDGRLVLPGQPAAAPFPVIFPVVSGSSALEAEDVLSLEAGFRHQPNSDFSWDASVFWSRYEDLIGLGTPGAATFGPEGLILPISFANSGQAQTYGLELTSTAQMTDNWKLQGNYTLLRMQYDGSVLGSAGDSPQHQVYLQSGHDLSDDVQLDLIWRYVDALPAQDVSGYSSFNIRLSWAPTDQIEVYAMGTNLLDKNHLEFGNDPLAGTQSGEVPRGVYGGVALRF